MRIAGYAAIFDRVDHGGDVIRRGAFARALRPGIPLLLQHDTGKRIGAVEHLEEDERGLRMIARIDEDVPVKNGTGLSFGYRVRAMKAGAKAGETRELTELDLIEVSVVKHPMQPLARVLATENPKGEIDGL